MYKLIHDITINDNIKLNKILSVKIEKTLSSYTNLCQITVPKYIRNDNKPIFTDFESLFFKKGDKFSIKLGYLYQTNKYLNDEQFFGFLSNIEILEHTVILHLEDYSYYLKLAVFNYVDANTTLKSLGSKIINDANKLLPNGVKKMTVKIGKDFPISDFKANNATALQILDLLKSNYILDSYFVGSELNLGINFDELNSISDNEIKSFSTFKTSVIKTVTNSIFYKILNMANLKFKNIDDIKLNVTLKNIIDGKVTETYYDNNGKVSTTPTKEGNHLEFIMYGSKSISEKNDFIKNQLSRIKYNGFMKGSSFTTYGLPFIEVKDVIAFDGIGFIRNFNETVEGQIESIYAKASYLVDGVSINYEHSGFRQEVILSNKVATKYTQKSLVQLLGKKTINI